MCFRCKSSMASLINSELSRVSRARKTATFSTVSRSKYPPRCFSPARVPAAFAAGSLAARGLAAGADRSASGSALIAARKSFALLCTILRYLFLVHTCTCSILQFRTNPLPQGFHVLRRAAARLEFLRGQSLGVGVAVRGEALENGRSQRQSDGIKHAPGRFLRHLAARKYEIQ